MVILLNLENLYESLYDVLNQVSGSEQIHEIVFFNLTLILYSTILNSMGVDMWN